MAGIGEQATMSPSGGISWLSPIETLIRALSEWTAAILVLAEVGILFLGIVARYGLNRPLAWSDELSDLLFLGLTMLESVIAFQRNQHMRILILVARLAGSKAARLEAISAAACLIAFALSLVFSVQYMLHEAPVLTPALQISGAWRSAALPAGFLMMLMLACFQLVHSRKTYVLSALVFAIVVCGAFLSSQSMLEDIGNYNLIVFFAGLVGIAILLGVPIGIAFLLATVLYLMLMTRVPLMVVIGRMDEGMSHFILLAVPLFVLLGKLMEEAGLAKSIMNFLVGLFGHVRGGLSYVLLAAMYIVSGISGSKVADMAAVAPVLFPEMKRRGLKPGELIALLSSSGAMSETIPPSLVLIATGVAAGVSIAALFTAGLLPALILALVLALVVRWRTRREVPSQTRRPPARSLLTAGLLAIPGMGLPILIRTLVVEGVATATEVSTVGILYTVAVGVVLYRPFPWRRVMPMLMDTASLSGAIVFILGAATAMAWALTQSGFSNDLSNLMISLPGGRFTFLAVSIVFFIVLGSLLEGLPAVVLFAPLLFPTAAELAIHEVHYAIVVIIAMGIGLFIPPFGVGYWAACAIGQVHPDEGIRPLWPYLAALLFGLIVIAAVPWISIGFL